MRFKIYAGNFWLPKKFFSIDWEKPNGINAAKNCSKCDSLKCNWRIADCSSCRWDVVVLLTLLAVAVADDDEMCMCGGEMNF